MGKTRRLAGLAAASLLVSAAVAGVLAVPGRVAKAAPTESVVISETFDDEEFIKYIKNNINKDSDKDTLTPSECDAVKNITVPNMGIKSLKGIEVFEYLERLDCYNNDITSLDVSKNTELVSLSCFGNKLVTLDASNNTKLKYLDCRCKTLKTMDFSKSYGLMGAVTNGDITKFNDANYGTYHDYNYNSYSYFLRICDSTVTSPYCTNDINFPDEKFRAVVKSSPVNPEGYSWLSKDEISKVTELVIDHKSISDLKGIECFSELKVLKCDNNNLTSLDLSRNTKLEKVNAIYNQLTDVTLGNNPNLKYLDICYNKNFAVNCDISGCGKLLTLARQERSQFGNYYEHGNMYEDEYMSYDVSAAIGIPVTARLFPDAKFREYIEYSIDGDQNNYLTLNDIFDVTSIDCSYCDISDLSGIGFFSELEDLDCSHNVLDSLSVASNSKLKYLDAASNGIKKLDLSKNTKLEEAYLSSNNLTSLNVSNNPDLICLSCSVNDSLTALDVSNCPNLLSLECSGVGITNLDMSKNPELTSLSCYGSKIKSIDVTNNTKLANLDVSANDITEIAIYNCPNILKAYKEGKQESYNYMGYDYTNYTYNEGNYYFFSVNKDGVEIITVKPTSTPTPTPTATATPTAKPSAKPTAQPTTVQPTTKPADTVTLTLDKEVLNIVCGKSDSLKATLTGATGTIAWTSSDAKIAAVDANGKITTKQAGTVTITATAAGKSAACTVTILYKDVTKTKDFWYAPTNYLTAKGVVKGYDKQTKFKPANDCTRAQMVTFLWRLAGEPNPKATTTKFKDVKKSAYYFKPVIWAVEQGITTGVSKTKFNPSGVCTRAQTVTFLWRMANKPEPTTKENKFKDVKKKDYFYKATLWASEKGILAG